MTASELRPNDRVVLAGDVHRVVTTRSGSEWSDGWDSFTVLVRERDGMVVRVGFHATDAVTEA
jgi:metallophosphoesterase superfamily enzyme